MTAALRSIPEFVDVWPWWFVRAPSGPVVAECHVFESDVPTVELGVLPDHRRHGMGTALIAAAASEARHHGKSSGGSTLLHDRRTSW